MKVAALILVTLACLAAVAMANYGYSYVPYYGAGAQGSGGLGNGGLLALIGLLFLLMILFGTNNNNNAAGNVIVVNSTLTG